MRCAIAVMAGIASMAVAAEQGFTSLFNGATLDGWKVRGGSAEYAVENGDIVGRGVPGTPGNTFLCTEKEYENFVFKAEFLCEGGNSGIQFRSSARPDAKLKHGNRVFGYQSEIRPDGNSCGRIYDEGRRGHKHKLVWLDLSTPSNRLDAAKAAFRKGTWNEMEIQCVGPSIKTWINGVKVADILDDCQQKGFFGLQIHASKTAGGVARWRNIRIRELPPCPPWKKFFVKGQDGAWKLEGARFVIPQDWSFLEEKDGRGQLRGLHDEKEKKDGLVVSDANYSDFMARVTYRIEGGNSALYFRAAEEDVPWLLKGFQNEIAGNNRDSALWHTRGKTSKGRGWVAINEELVAKVRNTNGWNTISTIAVGDRIVDRINGFETFDIIDPLCEKTGKLGLQLHGGKANEMRFMDWEVMELPPEMTSLMSR